MIFTAFFRALGQTFDPRFRRVLLVGIALAFALLVAVYSVFLLGIATLTPEAIDLPVIGRVEGLHTLLGWTSLFLMLGLSVFLMVPAAAAFAGLFLEDVVKAVEDRHYPFLPPARPLALGESIKASANLIGLIVVVNILAVFLYPLAGPAAPLVFWAVNGFLLGREYFTMVALRRMAPAEAKALRRANALRLWAAGTLMAVPLSVPLVNLMVPVIGTATFTHIFHRIVAKAG
ncbi:EI24 domain-containing protein [Rhodobacter sp. Har01]|uniref:EI24 domain-containing protein n=1 Tax=Rhodobacter sp. Har01 TaxID=2883999 RepID=UPI001D070428|nr:EI24 domain-containing protein [Rhodobacter sp. Har01]MCB6178939.1 EI24 domain-containing protein [Rhodobacter sp. Har01]